ncbi:hypothetical protein B0H15DRAFT_594489 [Mycena belliarum]|uniref:Uncharacterized protein n=1 Tax=Mycena belliarum TaxID=1033014 RepID=A0AAD6TQX1_9AGAR|nr:hypothetical protein B0H15DRAFT_594489 [Mycena belliae]
MRTNMQRAVAREHTQVRKRMIQYALQGTRHLYVYTNTEARMRRMTGMMVESQVHGLSGREEPKMTLDGGRGWGRFIVTDALVEIVEIAEIATAASTYVEGSVAMGDNGRSLAVENTGRKNTYGGEVAKDETRHKKCALVGKHGPGRRSDGIEGLGGDLSLATALEDGEQDEAGHVGDDGKSLDVWRTTALAKWWRGTTSTCESDARPPHSHRIAISVTCARLPACLARQRAQFC